MGYRREQRIAPSVGPGMLAAFGLLELDRGASLRGWLARRSAPRASSRRAAGRREARMRETEKRTAPGVIMRGSYSIPLFRR